MKKETIIFPFAFLIFGFFLSSGFASAQETICYDPQPVCGAESWTEAEYKCGSSACQADVLKRERTCERSYAWSKVCECTDIGWDCGVCLEDQTGCDNWSAGSSMKSCEDWQKCSGSGDWSGTEPVCACAGECLPKPTNPKLLDGEDKELTTSNITLPVKLDWGDVLHAQSYLVKTNGVQQPDFAVKSEIVPAACSFKSNSTNKWAAAPCCGNDGTNCKPWQNVDEWNFIANFAPEPVSPYDPDWTGVKGAENVSVPVTLDWCGVKDAGSYRLNIYIIIIEGGKNICHPDLLSTVGGKEFCDSWLLRKSRRDPEQIDKTLYSDFPDENMDFFTKDTNYAWQAFVCDENGLDCQIKSQLWKFSTKEAALASSLLVSPTNDPNGKTSVGLPLILDWNDQPGVNSFVYEVTAISSGQKIEKERLEVHPAARFCLKCQE